MFQAARGVRHTGAHEQAELHRLGARTAPCFSNDLCQVHNGTPRTPIRETKQAVNASRLISMLLWPIRTQEQTLGKPLFAESGEVGEGERPREP